MLFFSLSELFRSPLLKHRNFFVKCNKGGGVVLYKFIILKKKLIRTFEKRIYAIEKLSSFKKINLFFLPKTIQFKSLILLFLKIINN